MCARKQTGPERETPGRRTMFWPNGRQGHFHTATHGNATVRGDEIAPQRRARQARPTLSYSSSMAFLYNAP